MAAYRAADIARELHRDGWEVRVCLTDGAKQFVTPLLFESLTAEPVLDDVFDEPVRGRMAHIDWARWADLILIAPATANVIAKLAHGVADDMLTTIGVSSTAPIVLAPAMNPTMFASETNQAAMEILRGRGVRFVDPASGDVACGEFGEGKLAATEDIVATVRVWRSRCQLLAGRKVLITSGPTQEPIDDVRFIANRSSGKMGAALAAAARDMGADVTVVSGPAPAALPGGIEVVRVETAAEMLEAALKVAPRADLVLGAAAPADFRVANPTKGKIRRSDGIPDLRLEANPDIIAAIKKVAPASAVVIGFAAEPSSNLEEAREKLARKGLYAIAVNDVSRHDIGFGSSFNEITLITDDGITLNSGRLTKRGCADWLLDEAVKALSKG